MPQGILPYDPVAAEAQRDIRNYDTTAQIGADYAANRVADAQTYAQRELDSLLAMRQAGFDIPQDRIDELNAIAHPSFLARAMSTAAPVFKAIEFITRPAAAVQLGIKDIMGFDSAQGVEIGWGHYGDILAGRGEKLVDDLGIAVVGEDGRVGFSSILDDLGWSKTDNAFNNFLRGVATFAGEVATDPLTFTGFGAHGLDKLGRMRFLGATVDDSARLLRESLEQGTDVLARRGDALAVEMAEQGARRQSQITTLIEDSIDDAVRNGKVDVLERYGLEWVDDALQFETVDSVVDQAIELSADVVRAEAIDRAVVETSDSIFNNAVAPLLAKDFAAPGLRLVASAPGTGTYLRGGMRVTVPIYSKRAGGAGSLHVGGTGFGRRVSNALFGHSSVYANPQRLGKGASGVRGMAEGLLPSLFKRHQGGLDKFTKDQFLREVMGGKVENARAALRIQDQMAAVVEAVRDGADLGRIGRAAIKLDSAATEAGMSQGQMDALLAGMTDVHELRPGATLDEIIDHIQQRTVERGGSMLDITPEMREAIEEWSIAQKNSLDFLGDEMVRLGMVDSTLNNYTPHVTTRQGNELLDQLAAANIAIEGDTMAHQILRSMVDARRRARTVDEAVLGESAATSQRTVGRTALVQPTGNPNVPAMIGDTTLVERTGADAGLTAPELNDMFRGILDEIEDANPGFKRPKMDRPEQLFSIYNENPFTIIQAYGHDLTMALSERKMIELLEGAGLVADGVKVVNQQMLASTLAANLNKYGTDTVERAQAELAEMLAQKQALLDAHEQGLRAIDDEVVTVRVGGQDIDIPKSAVEANRKLQREISKITDRGRAAEAIQARQRAFYNDSYNYHRKQGVSEDTAHSLAAAATKKEIRQIAKAAGKEVRAMVRTKMRVAQLNAASNNQVSREAAEKLQAKHAAELHAWREKERLANEAADESLRLARDMAPEDVVSRVIASGADMRAVMAETRNNTVAQIRTMADNIRQGGGSDRARLLEAIADHMEANPTVDMRSLLENVEEIATEALREQRLHRPINEAAVARADTFVGEQAAPMPHGSLNPGDHGPEVYANAQFAFHGSDQATASSLIHRRRFGASGLSANPNRAANAASEDGWVLVYDIDSLPDHAGGSLRAGQDIESRQQLEQLIGEGALPEPVAILPAKSVREAIDRRLQGEEVLRLPDSVEDARRHALSSWHDQWAINADIPGRPGPPLIAYYEAETMVDLYRALQGESVADFEALDDFAKEVWTENADAWWGDVLTRASRGEIDEQLREAYDASQRSLLARGVDDEVTVWAVGNEYGMARLSLSPVEGAEPFLVRRQDIILDLGAVGQDADHVLVDTSRLTRLTGEPALGGFPSKETLHAQPLNPENLRSFFGDPDVADAAILDLQRRLVEVGTLSPNEMAMAMSIRESLTNWRSVEVVDQAPLVFDDPETYFDFFEDATNRSRMRAAVRDSLGQDVEFTRVTLVEDVNGWRVGTPGQRGGIEATVPILHEKLGAQRPTMLRRDLTRATRELGMTPTELKVHAMRAAEKRALTPQQFADLPQRRRELLEASEEVFDGADPRLFNTLMEITTEDSQIMDEVIEAAENVAALTRRGAADVSPTRILGPTRELGEGQARRAAHAAADENGRIRSTSDSQLGAAVSVTTGQSAGRGVIVGTGMGEMRFANNVQLREALDDWVEVNHEALSRGRAHVMIWQDGDEAVLEIGTVMDSPTRAQRLGVDLDSNAMFELSSGDAVSVPTQASKARAAAREAGRRSDAVEILEAVDTDLSGYHYEAAIGKLVDAKNASRLRESIGQRAYDDLLDHVRLQQALANPRVPGKEGLRAAYQQRKQLARQDTAIASAVGTADEAEALSRQTIEQEIEDALATQGRVAQIISNILGVGLDDQRVFGDPNLYANVQGVVTEDAAKQAKRQLKELKNLAKRLGWSEVATAAKETYDDIPYATIAAANRSQAERSFSVFGLGGRTVEYKTTSAPIAGLIEETISRWQILARPEGLEMFTQQLRWLARAWKSMATVARPNFHTRNFIGAAFNNMAVDVGVKEYSWVRNKMLKYRRLVEQGADDARMIAEFGDDWEVIAAARRQGIMGEGFAAGDFKIELKSQGKRPRDRFDPASGRFILNRAGGFAMQSIEDFHRMAAFVRWYDELGEAGARDMSNMVHFNYSNLTPIEQKMKQIVPFFVWTRNNIPLQMRLMVERPGLATRYAHLMSAVEDNMPEHENKWPGNAYATPFAADLGVQLGGDSSWARLVFDPDVPLLDLASFEGSPTSLDTWASFVGNVLGPHVTTPLNISQQNEWGTANAPFGFNAALRLASLLPGFDPVVSQQGDVQIGYGYRNLLNTVLPISGEYSQLLGLSNDPARLQRLGIDSTDGVSLSERLRGGALFLGRGLGISAHTPNDARSEAYSMRQEAEALVDELRLTGVLPPEGVTTAASAAETLRELGVIP